MDLVLQELNFEMCSYFIEREFGNGMLFTELLLSKQQLEKGSFFTIAPDKVKMKNLYEFKTGGKIYPFYRPKNVTVIPVRNDSENIFTSSLINYIFQSDSHFVGIEDYSAEPHFDYIKENGLKYHLLSNGHLFYFLDNNFSQKEILKYYGLSKGYLFLCLLLKLPPNSINFIATHKELSNEEILNKIFGGINSFFVEVYDGEGYLLWISKEDDSYLKIIKNQLINANKL